LGLKCQEEKDIREKEAKTKNLQRIYIENA
jgi:hypothetical protein